MTWKPENLENLEYLSDAESLEIGKGCWPVNASHTELAAAKHEPMVM